MTKKQMQDRMDYVAQRLKEYAESMQKEGIMGYSLSLMGLVKVLTEE